MPLALAFFGILFLTAGVRNTQGDLFSLLKGDFTGPRNFLYWIVALFFVGLIGYIPKLKPLSTAFIVLLLLVMFLANGGFFEKFQEAIEHTAAAQPEQNSSDGKVDLPAMVGDLLKSIQF